MSATWGAVKFKKTGNVYFGCYEGATDTFRPYICTPEECYDEKLDCYCSIWHCRELSKNRDRIFPDDVTDLDEVELYSDIGDGFYWSGTGSESLKMIKTGLDTLEEGIEETDGKPRWVKKFEKQLREKYLEKLWKRYQESGTDEDYKAWRDAKDEEW